MSDIILSDSTQGSSGTSQSKGNVFISYSRDDSSLMDQLHTELSALGRDVWVDWEDIKPTDDWLTDIYTNIEKTDTFLFLVSPQSITSPVCNLEIAHAVRLNKRLVPIIYQVVDFDKVMQDMSTKALSENAQVLLGNHDLKTLMRENWKALSVPSWLYFRTDEEFKKNFPRLIKAIDTDLGHVREHTRWLVRALEWDSKVRNPSFLLSGEQLREAETWLSISEKVEPSPTELHIAYFLASRYRETQRQRILFFAMIAALVVAVILAGYGFVQSQAAQNALSVAEARGTQASDLANVVATQLANAQRASTAASNADATRVSVVIAATYAQGQAQIEAANAATQVVNVQIAETQVFNAQITAVAAANARATSIINEQNALNNAATANYVMGQAQANVGNAATQVALATIAQNAVNAESNARATSIANEQIALNNAATATVAQGQAQIAAVQAQAAQATAEKRSYETQSFALTVAIEQLVNLGNPDLALALALEAVQIDPTSWVAQKRLLDVAFAPGTRLIFKPETTEPTPMPVSNASANSVVSPVTDLAYSPDMKYVASSSLDGTITLWDAKTGKQLQRFVGHTAGVNSVAFSPDSQRLVSASDDKSLILWDLEGHSLRTFQIINNLGDNLNRAATAVVFSPNGNVIISGWADGQVVLFDAITGQDFTHITTVANGSITHLRLSPDVNGQYFLAISTGNVSVWDRIAAELRRVLIGKDGAGDYSPDGNYALISSISDQNINGNDLVLVDISGGLVKGRYRGHSDRVTDVVFMPDGTKALSAGKDGVIILWDIQGQKELRRYYGKGTELTSLAVSPDGSSFVSADVNGEIRLWDTESEGLIRSLPDVKKTVMGLQYSHDGNTILASYDDKSVGFQNANDGSEAPRRFYQLDVITNFSYSPDEKNVLIADASGVVYAWDTKTYSIVNKFSSPKLGGSTVAVYSPDGSTVTTGDSKGTLRFWDVKTINAVNPRLRHDPDAGSIIGIFYFKDNKHLLTVHPDAIALRDVQTGNIIRNISARQKITRWAISPDERWLFTASDSRVILWDLTKDDGGQKEFRGDGETHTKPVNSLAFSPDGSAVLSSSDDGTIHLWDVLNGKLLFAYKDGDHIPHGVVFNPDGRTFAAGYDTQIVYFWSGARPVLADWVKDNRYYPQLTCADRDQYSLNPPCMSNGIVPTLTPTGILLPTLTPTMTLIPGGRTPTLTFTATPFPSVTLRADNDGTIIVRKGSGTGYGEVTRVSSGTSALLLETPFGLGWARVRLEDGQEGWVLIGVVN